jgi:hypothetical protein
MSNSIGYSANRPVRDASLAKKGSVRSLVCPQGPHRPRRKKPEHEHHCFLRKVQNTTPPRAEYDHRAAPDGAQGI